MEDGIGFRSHSRDTWHRAREGFEISASVFKGVNKKRSLSFSQTAQANLAIKDHTPGTLPAAEEVEEQWTESSHVMFHIGSVMIKSRGTSQGFSQSQNVNFSLGKKLTFHVCNSKPK